jgi:hypothetical protein
MGLTFLLSTDAISVDLIHRKELTDGREIAMQAFYLKGFPHCISFLGLN